MFGIGPGELILIFLIALFVLGPERLPSTARDLGRAMNELRKASDELTREFLSADQARTESPPAPAVPAAEPPAIEASARTTEAPPSEPANTGSEPATGASEPTAVEPEAERPEAERPEAERPEAERPEAER